MTRPILTVITPVFNGRRYIEGCIETFAAQHCADAVHLVVDGASTDGTADVVRAQMTRRPNLELISEPDRGQSDAMNKGIAHARTEYISFLNVDDFYEPGALNRVTGLLRGLAQPAMLVGNCNILGPGDAFIHLNRPAALKVEQLVMGWSFYEHPVNPVAYFYPKALHERIGAYDVAENFMLDLKFLLRAVQAIPTQYVDETWGNYRLIEGTKTFENTKSGNHIRAMRRVYRNVLRTLPLRTQITVVRRYLLWTLARQMRRRIGPRA